MTGMLGGADFNAEVAEIRCAVVNELGETAIFAAAEKGHLNVVKELLKYSTKEVISLKNHSGFAPLHIAASNGHLAIVRALLVYYPGLSKTLGPSNAMPLVSVAGRGHAEVVIELLLKDLSLLEMARSNGKNALHLSAWQ